jgi:hypothetical protein
MNRRTLEHIAWAGIYGVCAVFAFWFVDQVWPPSTPNKYALIFVVGSAGYWFGWRHHPVSPGVEP